MYKVVNFPEVQMFQMRPDFAEKAIFLGSSEQVERFGDSAWLIPSEWTSEIPEELAFSFAVKAGFEPIKMVSGRLISKKSETEFCYHLVTNVCLEYGHYGFSSAVSAERELLIDLMFDDMKSADLVGLNGENLQLIESDRQDCRFVLTEYAGDENRAVYEEEISDLPFDTNIKHVGVGVWEYENCYGKIMTVKCINFTQEGFCNV